jgi:hypothetical protein
MHIRQVAHNGGVNRLRACPQLPHLLATLADTASVHVLTRPLPPALRLSPASPQEASAEEASAEEASAEEASAEPTRERRLVGPSATLTP